MRWCEFKVGWGAASAWFSGDIVRYGSPKSRRWAFPLLGPQQVASVKGQREILGDVNSQACPPVSTGGRSSSRHLTRVTGPGNLEAEQHTQDWRHLDGALHLELTFHLSVLFYFLQGARCHTLGEDTEGGLVGCPAAQPIPRLCSCFLLLSPLNTFLTLI